MPTTRQWLSPRTGTQVEAVLPEVGVHLLGFMLPVAWTSAT
jgi:hypothetical protein